MQKRKIISKFLRLGRCPHKIENILLYHVNTTDNKLGFESLKALLQYFAPPASYRVHIICPQSEKKKIISVNLRGELEGIPERTTHVIMIKYQRRTFSNLFQMLWLPNTFAWAAILLSDIIKKRVRRPSQNSRPRTLLAWRAWIEYYTLSTSRS